MLPSKSWVNSLCSLPVRPSDNADEKRDEMEEDDQAVASDEMTLAKRFATEPTSSEIFPDTAAG